MHLEMDESGAVQWRLLWFCRSLREPQALSKGSSDAVMYVLATCGVREQPQERRGSRWAEAEDVSYQPHYDQCCPTAADLNTSESH